MTSLSESEELDDIASSSVFWEALWHGGSCLDTSMLQTVAIRGFTMSTMQAGTDGGVDRLAGAEAVLAGPTAPMVSNATFDEASASAAAHMLGSTTMLLLIATVSVLSISCVFCATTLFEQGASSPPGGRREEDHAAGKERASRRGALDESPARCQQRRRTWRGWRGRSGGQSMPYPSGAASRSSPREAALREAAVGQQAGGALFAVPVESLVGVTEKGSFLLRDVFSSTALRAVVSQSDRGVRRVQVFSGENAVSPWASVEPPPAPPGSQARLTCLELCNASGQQFASLTLQGDGSFVVSAQAQSKLVIEGNEADLDLHFLSYDGRVKATVSCKEVHPGGPEHVEIHVLPGIDPVLIVVCTLAIMFLCGECPEGEARLMS